MTIFFFGVVLLLLSSFFWGFRFSSSPTASQRTEMEEEVKK